MKNNRVIIHLLSPPLFPARMWPAFALRLPFLLEFDYCFAEISVAALTITLATATG